MCRDSWSSEAGSSDVGNAGKDKFLEKISLDAFALHVKGREQVRGMLVLQYSPV